MLHYFAQFWQSHYKTDPHVWGNFVVSLLLVIVNSVLLYYKLHAFAYLSPSGNIPLHFSNLFGIDSIGKWYYVFALPIFGAVLILVNTTSAYWLYSKDRILAQFLVYFQSVFNLLLLIAGIFIVLLNI